jgi:hypothetical protein
LLISGVRLRRLPLDFACPSANRTDRGLAKIMFAKTAGGLRKGARGGGASENTVEQELELPTVLRRKGRKQSIERDKSPVLQENSARAPRIGQQERCYPASRLASGQERFPFQAVDKADRRGLGHPGNLRKPRHRKSGFEMQKRKQSRGARGQAAQGYSGPVGDHCAEGAQFVGV